MVEEITPSQVSLAGLPGDRLEARPPPGQSHMVCPGVHSASHARSQMNRFTAVQKGT